MCVLASPNPASHPDLDSDPDPGFRPGPASDPDPTLSEEDWIQPFLF